MRENVKAEEEARATKEDSGHSSMKFSVGYGGKYGVLEDRKDKSAVGFDYIHQTEKHSSQKADQNFKK